MKALMLYPRLAVSGITKNRRQYLPYILACSGMVMMYYIVAFLADSKFIHSMKGGNLTTELLGLGTGIIAVFAAVFLFYTNSFLIRRRKTEFGLYNILGMGKRNIAVILVFETVLCYIISCCIGIGCGLIFSKLAELVLTRMVGGEASHAFDISTEMIFITLKVFAVIFALIMLNALRQIHLSKPIELLKNSSVGEKPPKANWLLALAGAVMLGAAYTIAVITENPVVALYSFFIAVVLVILGTYILFISGSVVVCKILRKNKRYYYKTNHFVSVSQMAYRMKRNGAGLASICILATMVIVTICSTGCLYFGEEKLISNRFPRGFVIENYTTDPVVLDEIHAEIDSILSEYGLEKKNYVSYKSLGISGSLSGDTVTLTPGRVLVNSDLRIFYCITVDDYNRITGNKVTLGDGEVLIGALKQSYEHDTLNIAEYGSLKIVGRVDDFISIGDAMVSIMPSMLVFVKDEAQLMEIDKMQQEVYNVNASHINVWEGFDLDCPAETEIEIRGRIFDSIVGLRKRLGDDWSGLSLECREYERDAFYGMYGGMFFLGILFSIVFSCAAVLIMYYKQISEGFEDKQRFEIMQKVGMTNEEVRKTVNSQVLTVFFLPLIASGVHTCFAFPIIYRLLMLFGLSDTLYLAVVTCACFGLFAALYIITYIVTSKSYYKIVSNERRNQN